MHMGIPTQLDHVPVVFVTVHGHAHAPAAAGDTVKKSGMLLTYPGTDSLKLLKEVDGMAVGVVTAVGKAVDGKRADALGGSIFDQRNHVPDVGMNDGGILHKAQKV
jgi:hypothetical protein